ncbi:MAG: hypothetical protein JXR86_10970 [Spirochaetales bacterium]|nr:hypothetical protein [Spirochaetales bacterium]
MILEKYSIGTGDRFGREASAQLGAVMEARKKGVELAIVWNKSFREHEIIHTKPLSVREAADKAVEEAGWDGAYYVDADHINLKSVDLFVDSSDFFTLDVADYIGVRATDESIEEFVRQHISYVGSLAIPGLEKAVTVREEDIRSAAEKYLYAVQEAGKIYRHLVSVKGEGRFVTEVSMDETENPQTPEEMIFILAAIARERIPAQTIAPKFSGRFNKGVDYVGDPEVFGKEFRDDMAVIAWAVGEFGLMRNLKLSIHSGSDKFSIYPHVRKAMEELGGGIHIKTAGTTWLEELIGLAESGGSGLDIAREVYEKAFGRFDELAAPYATVIDIDKEQLPDPSVVNGWTGRQYADALRHDQSCSGYNLNFRQLLHVGYKVASEMGERYLNALDEHRAEVARNVGVNLLDRHIAPLFL